MQIKSQPVDEDFDKENEDPQKDASVTHLICYESMPSIQEVMNIPVPYPYKKTYCGIELVFQPNPVEEDDEDDEAKPGDKSDAVDESGLPEKPKNFSNYKASDEDEERFSLPLDPSHSPTYSIGGYARRGMTPVPAASGGASSAGDAGVSDFRPRSPVTPDDDAEENRMETGDAGAGAGLARVDAGTSRADRAGGRAVRMETTDTGVQWRMSQVFVLRGSLSPIRLRRYSPILGSRTCSERDDDSLEAAEPLPPPSLAASAGPRVCKIARVAADEPRSAPGAAEEA